MKDNLTAGAERRKAGLGSVECPVLAGGLRGEKLLTLSVTSCSEFLQKFEGQSNG